MPLKDKIMKLKIICGILALVMISSGIIVLTRPPEEVVIVPPDNTVNTVMDKPTEGDPSTVDPRHSLYIAQGELQRAGGFKGTSIGASTSMGVSQGVASERTVVGKNAFKQSTSFSSLVKFGEQLYVWEENYLSRRADKVNALDSATWKNTAKKYTKDGWFDKIGYRCNELTGYILNDDTIIDAALEKEENGIYTFRYALDIEKSPYYLLHEMRNNAGTDTFAQFVKAEIVVTMDKDWIVKTLTTDCEYKVTLNSVLQNVLCTESLTETFYDIGYNGDLPYKDFFEKFFDSEVVGGDDPKELTAVDALMGMFEPYMGGNKLYANLDVANADASLAQAQICANIDIANTDNITFDVKLGDLFVAYAKNNLYLTYQDFKASTTVEGIMGFVETLKPLITPNAPSTQSEGNATSDGPDLESLLGGLELIIDADSNTTTVHLPLALGGLTIDANLVANGTEKGKLSFAYASVTLGDVEINIVPTEKWNVPERSGEYPELLGLTSLLDNGAISLGAKIADIDADLTFDIATKSLFVKCDKLGLNAALVDEVLYASLGEAKVKFALQDVGTLMQLLAPFVKVDVQMPKLDAQTILAALSELTATETDNGVKFAIDVMGIGVEILLNSDENGWNLDSISINADNLNAQIAPSERFETPEINADEYVDVTEVANTFIPAIEALINAEGYHANANVDVALGDKTYNALVDILYDASGNVKATATVKENDVAILCADVTYADSTVFIDVNGIRAAFAVNGGSISLDQETLGKVLAVFDENELVTNLVAKVTEIIDNVKNFDVNDLDVGSIISALSYENGKLDLTANGAALGLGDVNVSLGTTTNGLTIGLTDFVLADVTLNLNGQVEATTDTVTIPNTDDYVLRLKGEVAGINILLAADLTTMDVNAEVNFANDTVLARFVDGMLYAELGNVRVKLSAQYLMDTITKLVGANGANTLAGLDADSILQGLSINLAADKPVISLTMGEVAIAINFMRTADGIVFENISANVGTVAANISQTDATPAIVDTNKTFQNVEPLIDRVLELINVYTNAQGIEAALQTELTIADNKYFADVTLQYATDVHATLAIRNDKATLANVELYYQDNALFVDLNGIRAAVKTDTIAALIGQLNGSTTASITDTIKSLDIAALNEILQIVTELPEKLKAAKFADILTSLTADGDVWTLTANATALGLGEFALVIDTANQSIVLSNLTLGQVTVNSLSADVAPFDGAIAKQDTADYVTEVLVEVAGIKAHAQLDAYNLEARAYAEAFNSRIDLLLDASGTVYVNVGDAKLSLNLSEIDQLIAAINKFVKEPISLDGVSIDLKELINSIGVTSDAANGTDISLSMGGIGIALALSNDATLDSITVGIGGTDLTVSLTNDGNFAEIDTTATYVNAVEVLNAYADSIVKLINGKNFAIDAKGEVAFGENNYGVDASIMFDAQGNLFVDAVVSFRNVNAINARIWLVDNVLYVDANDLTLKLSLGDKSGNGKQQAKSIEETLAQFMGYNDDVDVVLNLVCSVIGKLDTLNLSALLGEIVYADNALTLNLNGAQLDLGNFALTLENAANGLSANVSGLTHKHISVNLAATVEATDANVVAPNGDFSTNLVVTIDENNTLYANLDLMAGVYRFALNDTQSGGWLYVLYANNSFKVVKPETKLGANDAVSISGKIDVITDIVEKIDYMVKQLSNGLPIEFNPDGTVPEYNGGILGKNPFGGVLDLKQLVKSITLVADTASDTVTVGLSVFGINAEITLKGGDNPTIENIYLPVGMLNLELNAKPDTPKTYVDFDKVSEYVEIDKVLSDYYPTIAELVQTNCWKFEFKDFSQIDIYDAASGKTDQFRIASGSYVEFFYNQKMPDRITLRALITVQIPSTDGTSWQDLVTLDVLFGKDENNQQRLWLTYNNDLRLTVAMDSIYSCVGLFDELKAAIPQIGTLIDSMMDTMAQIKGNLENVDYTTIIREIAYNSETSAFDLTLNAGVLLSNLGDLSLQVTRDAESMTLNSMNLTYSEYNDQNAVTKTISIMLNGLKVSSAPRITGPAENGHVNTPEDYDISTSAADYIKTYGLYNGDTDTYNTSNFISFDSLPELLKAVVDTANKTTFAIDGAITVKADVKVAKLTLPINLSIRVDRVQHADGTEDVYIAAMLQRFNTKATLIGFIPVGVYADYGGQSYLYYDSSVEYTDKETGETKRGWFWVSRDSYTNKTTDEAWTETTTHDKCTDPACPDGVASENCYKYWCNLCNKEADENCRTIGYCTKCKAVTGHCDVDWCSQCNKPADENCYVDYCNDCGKPATDECKTWWCHDCQKPASSNPFDSSTCSKLLHNRGDKHSITSAHSKKIVAAHSDKMHTSGSIRDPHKVNTIIEQTPHTSGKPEMEKTFQIFNGSADEFVNGKVDNNGYPISNLENSLYKMLNLTTTANLEKIIVEAIHKNDNQTPEQEQANDSNLVETILGKLQLIFKNYEYVVPQEGDEKGNSFFKLTADLSPINSSFGTLELAIGHTITYTEKQIENVFGELTTQKVVDKLNLTYLRGGLAIANIVDVNFQMVLAQNWQDYAGDAQYYVENQPAWDAADHKADFEKSAEQPSI